MLKPHEAKKMAQTISKLGRTIVEKIIIGTSDQITNDEVTDHVTRSSIRDGNVEVEEILHCYILQCGHLGRATSISGTCDICGLGACSNCLTQCGDCNLQVCRLCSKVYNDGRGEQILCISCYEDAKMKNNIIKVSKAALSLFIRTKED